MNAIIRLITADQWRSCADAECRTLWWSTSKTHWSQQISHKPE